jgi:hypothetical protein
VIRKVLFLIGNRHFLIRKCHFGIGGGSYVERGQYANAPYFSFQELQMIRRRLLVVATVVASVVLAACSDMTAPRNDVCPVQTGSSTCK